jgi:hypothetical protein
MTRTRILIAATLLAASAGMAFAQGAPPAGGAPGGPGGPGGGGRGRLAACQDDMAKFCADKTGPDRRQCLMDNKDKVSAPCKAAMSAPPPAAPPAQ